jgi:hypothetical protein
MLRFKTPGEKVFVGSFVGSDNVGARAGLEWVRLYEIAVMS